jgi:hypothetical protein
VLKEFAATITRSIAVLDAPYTPVGFKALSVLMANTFGISASIAASITLVVPTMFVLTASIGNFSQVGTCFNAAACIKRVPKLFH